MIDLFNVSEFLFTILYADYTCVLMNGKHLEDLVTRMQKELTSHTSDLYMGDSILTATDKLIYLGVLLMIK